MSQPPSAADSPQPALSPTTADANQPALSSTTTDANQLPQSLTPTDTEEPTQSLTPTDAEEPTQSPGRWSAADRLVIKQSLGVAVATGLYGVTAGALAVAAGLTVLQAMALSLLLFSGGSQFAFFGVIGAGGSPAAAIASSTLLGVRNGFYGLQVSQLINVHRWMRPVAAHFTLDESTAVAITQPAQRQQRIGFWLTGVGIFAIWNLMTFIGAVAGEALGDPRTYGLDAAAAAAFVGLLWPRLRGREPLAVAALAVIITVTCAPFVPAGVPVLAAVLAALAVGLPRRRINETVSTP